MLQLNHGNEQFGSLPSLRTIEHTRQSIITTDRPDSSQLVDLHVYIVPKTVWKDGQRLAQNDAMEDAVSAGFVRVPPNMTIRNLRKSIENSCGSESYFPRDFLYLRSVGRCMTKVKPKQEEELRVKNYRPPQTFAPEIYLLEDHSEDHRQASAVSPTPEFSSTCDICGNYDGHRGDHDGHHSDHNGHHTNHDENHPNHNGNRLNHDDTARSPSKLSQNYHRKPMRGGKHYSPTRNPNDMSSNVPSPGRQNWSKFTQIASDPEESSTNFSDATSVVSSKLSKLKEEQERLRRRQAELERMRRAAEEKKARSERSDREHSRSDAEEEPAKRIQPSNRGSKDHDDTKERKRNDNQKISNSKRSKLGGNNNEFDKTQNEISSFSKERAESIRSDWSPLLSTENRRTENQLNRLTRLKTHESFDTASMTIDSPVHSSINTNKHHANEHNLSNETAKKPPQSSYTSLSTTTPEIKPNEETVRDEIDVERREAESKRRRQFEEEEQKRKTKDLEEQKRKESNRRQRDDPDSLRARHQEIRLRRADLEKIREDVIKHLKNIHNRITLRRKEARDLWKKKYFNEKKKHPPLDERIVTLKNELEQIHKKTIQAIETEAKNASHMGYTREAETGNSMAQIKRVQHEIQDIRHQVEQAKLRLTTDVKLRNQAENECRTLKHELNQAKMNLNVIKSRVGP